MPNVPVLDPKYDAWIGTNSADEVNAFFDTVQAGKTSHNYQHFDGRDGADVITAADKRFDATANDNKIVVGSNGAADISGIQGVDHTAVDAGSGNDEIYVDALKGAFDIKTGDGQDDVYVYGGNYIKIWNSGDAISRGSGDTFNFGEDFRGVAYITGFDSTLNDRDSSNDDVLNLHGNWKFDGRSTFYRTDDGNTKVVLEGFDAALKVHNPNFYDII